MPDIEKGEAEPERAPTLREPAGGVPPLVDTPAALAEVAAGFAAGTGPVALDAERASGHRYGQRAFLVQAKRRGAGVALLDPEALPDLRPFAEALEGSEWVLHSATQDLGCLADLGLRPARLFDTELAARMLGLPRVGLASLTESLLGWHLAKGHSAADWSIRPLPAAYLRYAALDVELLLELRDLLEQRLAEAGRLAWAQQEFDHLLGWTPRAVTDPWRRTAGSHRLRSRRALAVLRALWTARDDLARDTDQAPGRVIADAALVAAAEHVPRTAEELQALPGFKRQGRRRAQYWLDAVSAGAELPEADLPPLRPPADGPPNHRSWAGKDPAAAARLERLRAAVVARAEELAMPAEVLIAPALVRRLAWQPPADGEVADRLLAEGARPWQVEQLGALFAAALATP